MQFDFNYRKEKNNFFSDNFISQNSTQTNFFILPESNDSFNINYFIEKYFPILSTTSSISTGYTSRRYKNIVNNSDLRNNESNNFHLKLYFKTAFDFSVNFLNTVRYNLYTIKTDTLQPFENSFLHNNFQMFWTNEKQWFASLSLDYLNPSLESPNQSTFLDFNIRYTTRNGKIQFSLVGNNLTNNIVFEQKSISDLGRFENGQSLNERYLLFKVRFKI
jgi:hypothetical protein